jgi:hypothetical protein
MAEIVREVPVTGVEEDYKGPIVGPPRISWGAIFAGAFSALGLWMLLYAFGLAVGLTALDPNNHGSLRSSGIFTGVWGLIAPLVALFVGGFIAGRGAGIFRRGEGAVHGVVMWGLVTVVGSFLVISAAAAILRGVATVGQAAVRAGGSAIGAVADRSGGIGAMAQRFGIDADDALRPVNDRLRAQGQPPVRAEQLQAATQDAVQSAIREGRVDRDLLVRSIAQNTAMSRQDVEETATRIEMQIDNARNQVGQRVQAAETGALKAAESSGKVFWGVFGALLLGLIAAAIGAALGVPHLHARRRERVVTPAPTPVPPPPRQPREVYP